MKRWEASTEAMAAIDDIVKCRGMSRERIIAALMDNNVRNAIVIYDTMQDIKAKPLSPDAEIEARR